MTREEAIHELETNIDYSTPRIKEACAMAIKSLEMWDEVIQHLKSTANELLEIKDENYSHYFAKGITFAVSMITVHLEEAES